MIFDPQIVAKKSEIALRECRKPRRFQMTTKVALYCRVSTNDQYPENQVRILSDLAEKNGADVVSTFIDKGISGVKKDRDALNQMMSAARSVDLHPKLTHLAG